MLDLRIMSKGVALPLGDLPAAVGRKVAWQEVGDQIEALIAFMDDLGGDPDLEDNGDHEASDGDDKDVSWFEQWHGRRVTGGNSLQNEDDEEDDDDACMAGDDDPTRHGDSNEDEDVNDVAWPESVVQGYNLMAGCQWGDQAHEDAEPRWAPPVWIIDAANDL